MVKVQLNYRLNYTTKIMMKNWWYKNHPITMIPIVESNSKFRNRGKKRL